MTADEARGRVGEIRAGLRRAMRLLSMPSVDLIELDSELSRVSGAVAELRAEIWDEVLGNERR